jgi:hypothetical protein
VVADARAAIFTSFDESISFNHSDGNAFGRQLGPESISIDITEDFTHPEFSFDYSIVASVITSGGVRPMIDIQGNLDANGLSSTSTGHLAGRASGRIQYGFTVVERTSPIVFVPRVPVRMHSRGHVTATGPTATAGLSVSLPNFSPIVLFTNSGRQEFDRTFLTEIAPGNERQITMSAFGDVDFLREGQATFQALVDPLIEIDPSFALKDHYEIRFSTPHVLAGPEPLAAVPEPSCLVLFGAGLLSLAAHGIWRR